MTAVEDGVTATPPMVSPEVLRCVFEHADDAILVIDPEADRIVEANPKACSFFGHPREVLLARPVSALCPQKIPDLAGFTRSVDAEGASWSDRLCCSDAAGAVQPAEVSAYPVWAEGRKLLVAHIRVVARTPTERVLREIFSGTASVTGEAFFQALVKHLAMSLGVKYAFVGELTGAGGRIRTLGIWANGALVENTEYELRGTPCERVFAGETIHVPREVSTLYPQDRALAEWRIESYLGVPLRDAAGRVHGHLAIMDDKPMPAAPLEMSVFEVCAERARAELEAEHMEQAVRKSEAQLRRLADALPALIAYVDADERYVFANTAFEDWFGISAEAIRGRRVRDTIGEPADVVLQPHRRRVLAGESQRVTVEMRHRRLGPRSVELLYTPHCEEDGRAGGYYVLGTDITERREFEAALAESEARYRGLFENESDAMLVLDAATRRIEDANHAAEALFGYAKEELLRLTMLDLSAEPEQTEERIRRTLAGDAAARMVPERYLRRKDGAVFPGEIASALFRSGGRQKIITAVRDITERKRAQEALQRSEERFQTLARVSPSVIFRTAIDGSLLYVNERWHELTGQRAEDVEGEDWAQAIHPEDRERALEGWRAALAARRPYRSELRFLRADGSSVWVTAQAEPERDDAGNVVSYVGVCTDITAQKEAELQLREAKDAAEAANRAKTEFLASMSHELRTPLNGVLGYAQLLKRSGLTESQRDAVSIIQQCGEHLLNLINDLLDLSRIEAGKLEITPREFELSEFLRVIAETTRIRAEEKGIEFRFEAAPGLPSWVRSDEKRLRQILVNLLGNAIKFTDAGSVRLGVEHRDGRVYFEVEDTGIGISEERTAEIFLPFRQIPQAGRAAEGTGLGLAICRRLTDALGGTLTVASAPGQGSVFRLELPLPEVAELNGARPCEARDIVGYQGERVRVLVAEDHRDNRRLLCGMLAPLGFEVAEAADGQEMLDQARAFRPDVVLVDLVMPVLDGFEATRRLRRLPGLEHVKVIAISASAFEEDRTQSLGAGCDDFLSKPICASELLERLEQHLHIEWIHGEPPTGDGRSSALVSPDEVGVPPEAELAALRELVEIGDIQGVVDVAARLEAANPRYKPFAAKVNELARGFQVGKLRELLQASTVEDDAG